MLVLEVVCSPSSIVVMQPILEHRDHVTSAVVFGAGYWTHAYNPGRLGRSSESP